MSPEDIIREANELARQFYKGHGYEVREGYRFDRATHPQEQMMWALAAQAYAVLRDTDLDDVLAELDE